MHEHLERISQLKDFDVAPGEPDIRGWTVKTAQGREVGSVSDLIVDTEAMKVRQIEVNLNRDATPSSGDHQVMAPIAAADIDTHDKSVILHGLSTEQIGAERT
jgi:sporulation protein YlmC with PRC-barrel domain